MKIQHTILAFVIVIVSCVTIRPHTGVVIEKTQPFTQIQCVIVGTDSTHFIYPSLTIDERDSLQIGDTILIDPKTLKML